MTSARSAVAGDISNSPRDSICRETWQYSHEWSHRSVTTKIWSFVPPIMWSYFVRIFAASTSSSGEEASSYRKCFALRS